MIFVPQSASPQNKNLLFGHMFLLLFSLSLFFYTKENSNFWQTCLWSVTQNNYIFFKFLYDSQALHKVLPVCSLLRTRLWDPHSLSLVLGCHPWLLGHTRKCSIAPTVDIPHLVKTKWNKHMTKSNSKGTKVSFYWPFSWEMDRAARSPKNIHIYLT